MFDGQTPAMASPGMRDLKLLLSSMTPTLDPSTYVFCTATTDRLSEIAKIDDVQMLFREAEGWTTILPQHHQVSELAIESAFPCKKVTLNVHSSLDAVGFIASIGKRLAELEIGVNPVSGFYHDHLFIPTGREDDVMKALRAIAEEARKELEEPKS